MFLLNAPCVRGGTMSLAAVDEQTDMVQRTPVFKLCTPVFKLWKRNYVYSILFLWRL